jgi:hypothetical protein
MLPKNVLMENEMTVYTIYHTILHYYYNTGTLPLNDKEQM